MSNIQKSSFKIEIYIIKTLLYLYFVLSNLNSRLRLALLYDDKWRALFGNNYKKPMVDVLNLAKIWYKQRSLNIKLNIKLFQEFKYVPGDYCFNGEDLPVEAERMINGDYGNFKEGEPDVYVIFSEDKRNNSGGVSNGIGNVCNKVRGKRLVVVEGLVTKEWKQVNGQWEQISTNDINHQWTGLVRLCLNFFSNHYSISYIYSIYRY